MRARGTHFAFRGGMKIAHLLLGPARDRSAEWRREDRGMDQETSSQLPENEATNKMDATDTPFAPAAHRLGEDPDWVVGVIDDPLEADRVFEDALAAGFSEDSIVVLSGQNAVDVADQKEAEGNALQRLYAHITRYATDPGNAERDYRDEATQGHAIVSIRAGHSGQIATAQQVLANHGGHRIKHFGKWTMTDLAQ